MNMNYRKRKGFLWFAHNMVQTNGKIVDIILMCTYYDSYTFSSVTFNAASVVFNEV